MTSRMLKPALQLGHLIPANFDAIFTFATSVSKSSVPKYVELSRGTDHDEVAPHLTGTNINEINVLQDKI